jgi:hypothetical protein
MDFDTFPLFSYLPAELRVKIWELNLPGPRLVILRYTSATTDPSNHSTRKQLRGCTSPTPIPTNLHINREARVNALQYYQLSFNLHHCASKIWFDFNDDVLYFPSKEGWLGSWNHFVNAVAMITPAELGKLRRLAVHESLFRGVKDATSSPNVQATCVREFWEYVSRKFGGVEEVAVLFEDGWRGRGREDDARVWMEGVFGYVLGKDGVRVGSPKERLVEGLERGLRFVEEGGWRAPSWDVLTLPRNWNGFGTAGWPAEALRENPRGFSDYAMSHEMLDSIVIPHSEVVVKEEQGFWMGGQLPHWHYLARV